jgi:hypothetical protein
MGGIDEDAGGLGAFLEGRDLLRNAVFRDGEVFGAQASDVVPFAVGEESS